MLNDKELLEVAGGEIAPGGDITPVEGGVLGGVAGVAGLAMAQIALAPFEVVGVVGACAVTGALLAFSDLEWDDVSFWD